MSKKISFSFFALALVAAMLLAFMAGFAVADNNAQGNALNAGGPASSSTTAIDPKLQKIVELIKNYSYYEIDEEILCDSLLQGLPATIKDRYAVYYDAEEYAQLVDSSAGSNQGIGITIIHNTEHNCIEIINIATRSPAASAGLAIGDLITHVGIGESKTRVSDIGYEAALDALTGKAGTYAEFTVTRSGEEIEFSVLREAYTADSVLYHVCTTDSSVGILRLIEFNLPAPKQFCEAMDALIAAGCTRFVIDVRNNPGGDLKSVAAILSFILQKDDIYIRTSDREGTTVDSRVTAVTDLTGSYADCNVPEEDIGKYREYLMGKSAVITNGSTASAAELFTSAMMDYDISAVVGTKTYGKGSMQSIFSLFYYGYEGALKITTKKYFPPISDGFDGIGIYPDTTVEIDEAIKNKNI